MQQQPKEDLKITSFQVNQSSSKSHISDPNSTAITHTWVIKTSITESAASATTVEIPVKSIGKNNTE
jgi:hypothetical protein